MATLSGGLHDDAHQNGAMRMYKHLDAIALQSERQRHAGRCGHSDAQQLEPSAAVAAEGTPVTAASCRLDRTVPPRRTVRWTEDACPDAGQVSDFMDACEAVCMPYDEVLCREGGGDSGGQPQDHLVDVMLTSIEYGPA